MIVCLVVSGRLGTTLAPPKRSDEFDYDDNVEDCKEDCGGSRSRGISRRNSYYTNSSRTAQH